MRFAGGNVVCCIEGREIFADDFVRGVTFDFLCACVPGDHVAVGIQQINGVLLDAIHQNVELFDGLVQCGAAGQLLKHRLRRQISHTIRTSPLIWFPRRKNNFIERAGSQVAVCSHPTLSVREFFLFRFLYFCPLEDDLDFDEEV